MTTKIKEYIDFESNEMKLYSTYHKKHGLCLEILMPLPSDVGAITLTKPYVQDLVRELQNWLGETELPFERIERRRKTAEDLGLTEIEAIDFGVLSDEY